MKLKPSRVNRVQIRVAEIDYVNRHFKSVKGRFRSMTIYETSIEEVWAIIEQALKEAEGKG